MDRSARRLARDAEAVCRHYLSNGRRQGRYWLVGDVANTPGRSLFVRLTGPESGKGAAGKWTDVGTNRRSFQAMISEMRPIAFSRSTMPSVKPVSSIRNFRMTLARRSSNPS